MSTSLFIHEYFHYFFFHSSCKKNAFSFLQLVVSSVMKRSLQLQNVQTGLDIIFQVYCDLEAEQNSSTSINPGGAEGKESACNVGDLGSISGSGRSPGERNGNPLQYSCLENSMDRGAWWARVHGVTKSWMQLTLTHKYFRCISKINLFTIAF